MDGGNPPHTPLGGIRDSLALLVCKSEGKILHCLLLSSEREREWGRGGMRWGLSGVCEAGALLLLSLSSLAVDLGCLCRHGCVSDGNLANNEWTFVPFNIKQMSSY